MYLMGLQQWIVQKKLNLVTKLLKKINVCEGFKFKKLFFLFYKVPILRIILELEEILTDPKFDSSVREISIDLLMKNLMHMDGGLPRGWSWRFIEGQGFFKMLHLATQVPELSDYPVSIETRQHVAIFLTRLYDDMVYFFL
jgi:hypothetical protein